MQALVGPVTTGAAVAASGEIADDMLMTPFSADDMLMTPFSADDEKNADFVKAYKDAYDETPNQFAADAYDCVHAIAEAIDKAGIDITADGADIAGDLAKAMRKIKIECLTGELTWNDEGQVEKSATAYVIQDGKYIAA